MRKAVMRTSFALAILLGLSVIVQLTGILTIYVVPTPSSEPNLKINSWHFASKLKTPRRMDFIVYYTTNNPDERPTPLVARLCGLPGDKIEIKDGILYVNDKNADTALNLNLVYVVSKKELITMQNNMDDEDFAHAVYLKQQDSSLVALDKKFVKDNDIHGHRIILPVGDIDDHKKKTCLIKAGMRINLAP